MNSRYLTVKKGDIVLGFVMIMIVSSLVVRGMQVLLS